MARTARRGAMARMPISALSSSRNAGERGAALIEAALALGLVALIAAVGLSAFSRAAGTGAGAEARLEALSAAENALERGSAPDFLGQAREGAVMNGEGWTLTGTPYEMEENGPLILIRLVAEAGPRDAPLVRLETLRSLPR